MRVLLADDHPLFTDGLKNLLTLRGFEVVGTARDGLEALVQARALKPDLILLDIQMPKLDGIAALKQIKAEMPGVRVVMLTMSAQDEDLFETVKCGANGYLLKSQETSEFLARLDELERGEVALSPGLATKILHEFKRMSTLVPPEDETEPGENDAAHILSRREIEVLALVADGLTYKEVGSKLNLSERAIKHQMGKIVRVLQVGSRAEAVAYARSAGLTEPQP